MEIKVISVTFILLAFLAVATINSRTDGGVEHKSQSKDYTRKGAAPSMLGVKTDPEQRGWSEILRELDGSSNIDEMVHLFKTANDCLLYRQSISEIENISKSDNIQMSEGISEGVLNEIDATSSRNAEIIESMHETCRNSDTAELADVSIRTQLRAALLGSSVAQVCYVSLGYDSWPIGNTQKSKYREDYLKYAPVFMEGSLKREEPYLIYKAIYSYTQTNMGHEAEGVIEKIDPVLVWRYARLASIRANEGDRKILEGQLEILKDMNIINASDIRRQDSIALNIYSSKYSSHPRIVLDYPSLCFNSI